MKMFFVNMYFEVWAENEDSAEEAVDGLINWDNQPDSARVETMSITSIGAVSGVNPYEETE